MKFGDKGMALLREFEGYHTRQPDGSCVAYLDRLAKPHVWTIGFGLTEGVHEGMRLTAEEAEACLRKELAKHEAAVIRLVTVDLNQNQFDALVSFSYNVGFGALGRSTLLKRLNAGDIDGAAREFARWNKAGGVVYRGLVRRRAAEAALFLEPVDASPLPDMPQAVEETPPRPQAKPVRDATGGAVASGAGLHAPATVDLAVGRMAVAFGMQYRHRVCIRTRIIFNQARRCGIFVDDRWGVVDGEGGAQWNIARCLF